jgi:rhodanese-related sulfurtransferase
MQDLTTFISNHMALTYSFAIILLLLFIIELLRAKQNKSRINTSKAIQLINREHAVIIDIRAQDNYRQGHIIDAISIPESDLIAQKKKLERYKQKPIIFICNNGTASQKVAALLLKEGYNIYLLAGGMRAWREAGLPIIKD